MNIAIVTVYDGLNYGSFLQAYAMNKFLESYGHNVFFVQRISEEENLKSFTTNRLSNNCGLIKKIWRTIKNIPQYTQISNQIISVRKQFPYFQEAWKELKIIQKENLDNIDCIVCGSDEIWNLNNAYIDTDFYICSNYGYNIRKIAVAVSIGNTMEEQVLNNATFIKVVNQFESILVRDLQTQNGISKITNKKLDVVCDPTLLIKKELFIKDLTPIIKGKYILVYAYTITEKQEKIIIEYSKKNNLKIISPCNYLKIADEVIYINPLDFANLMYNAECCYTSTFHGAIFSLLFAKRVCIYPKLPKVLDAVENINAMEHVWSGKDITLFEKIISRNIQHDKIDNAIQHMREKSIRLILANLKNCM